MIIMDEVPRSKMDPHIAALQNKHKDLRILYRGYARSKALLTGFGKLDGCMNKESHAAVLKYNVG